ncbi:MAG: Lrp/AsnC family transcriptional regulator [Pseudomonadota bacterium]|nr:Lrp/AsnC family transcriptional regulator [Pseudomonadota bacterium]
MTISVQDNRILELLSEDAKLSHAEIGTRVGLSTSSVHRRVRAMEKAGIIEGYGVRINEAALDRATSVFVQVTLGNQQDDGLQAFEQAARKSPDIAACYLMTGEADYLLRIAVSDTADYERVHRDVLTRLPNVERVISQFAIRTVCQKTLLSTV